jgi:hypothetical protein
MLASASTSEPNAEQGVLAALGLLLRTVAGASSAGLVASASFFREHFTEAEEHHKGSVLLAVLSALAPVFRRVAASIP